MRASPRTVVPVLMTLSLGCSGGAGASGGASPSGPSGLDQGRVDCAPSVDCLPEPDIRPRQLTRTMRYGWTLAEESFLVPPPAAAERMAATDLARWSSEVLAPWLERKTHTIEAARRELDQAAGENHRQRIIGGALVGLMYEDVALVLQHIPVPTELRDEPEIQEIYRQTLASQARPFLEFARRAYSACAQNGVQPATMRHWSRFCAGREAALPPPPLVSRGRANGETVVEVIAD